MEARSRVSVDRRMTSLRLLFLSPLPRLSLSKAFCFGAGGIPEFRSSNTSGAINGVEDPDSASSFPLSPL